MKKVRVDLGSKSYEVHIGLDMLGQSGSKLKEIGLTDKAVIVTDPKVRKLHGNTLEQSLVSSGFEVKVLEVPAGEEQKSLESADRLYEELTDFNAERTTPVIALGGGVIGDLAGFVAATYMRGVPLVQVPTTLLAQVDSSIGGKVAINHGQLKNKIGAFYQPELVLSDISTLSTLTSGDLSDGLAETIKYGVIWDENFFTYIESNINSIKSLDADTLETIVFNSARIKATVVEKDERDFGLRNILNFGHTVGHAIESVTDFSVQHGEAVAIGMLAEARISYIMGILSRDEVIRLQNILTEAGLPTDIPTVGLAKIIDAMRYDKKVLKGKLKFALPESIGKVFITDEVDSSIIERVLAGKYE